jgi:hypothetical protein
MQTYLYPNNFQLTQIDQNLLPVYELQDPIFKMFPVRTKDTAHVIWEQKDDYTGVMQIRGYDGEFPMVQTVGINRFTINPGIYGEGMPITEQELTERRGFGQISQPISIADLVQDRHLHLMTRHWNRMSQITWTLLATGTYSVINDVTNSLGIIDAYQPQSYTSGTPWSTTATATPLADYRAVQLLHRGHSVSFGSKATAFQNLATWNAMIANSNTADLGGRRSTGLETIEGVAQYSALALKDNLPMVEIWDEGYKSDGITDNYTSGTFTTFIPDGAVIIIGKRTNGAPVGEFQLTRNAQNPDVSPGYFVKVTDSMATEHGRPPRKIEVFRGFNGGPQISYGSAIVILQTGVA